MTKLTPEQIASNLAAYKHAMEVGHLREIEIEVYTGKWEQKEEGCFWIGPASKYRLRPTPPEPKWRAWDCHSIPVGNLIKIKHNGLRSLITSAGSTNARVGETRYSYQDIFDKFEQLDGRPAGVLE